MFYKQPECKSIIRHLKIKVECQYLKNIFQGEGDCDRDDQCYGNLRCEKNIEETYTLLSCSGVEKIVETTIVGEEALIVLMTAASGSFSFCWILIPFAANVDQDVGVGDVEEVTTAAQEVVLVTKVNFLSTVLS